ncbi:MAG TPA: hypothetical protein PK280_13805 [Planctomycetota bacterium]|nr:hypothetical protein [Planctomycetota bacterium]
MKTCSITTGLLLVPALIFGGEPPTVTLAPAEALTVPDNRWTRIAEVPPDPLGRELEPGRGAYLCFEGVKNTLLRFGGYTPTDDNSMWSFDLPRRKWDNPVPVSYEWPAPADRPGAGPWWSMAWDSKRKVVWLCGGWGLAARSNAALYDIWQYDPARETFRAMKSKGLPGGSVGVRIVYDSKNDLVVRAPADAEGGWWMAHNKDTTWVYDPGRNAWEGRKTPGVPKDSLGLAAGFVFASDAGKTVYMRPAGKDAPMETWTYDAAANTWEKLTSRENPQGAVVPGVCYDSANKQVVLYGGVGAPYLSRGQGVQLHDTWALDLAVGQWRKLAVGAPIIAKLPGEQGQRFELTMAMDYDQKNQAVILAEPTIGVWALRVRPEGTKPLPELRLAALPAFDKPAAPERVYPQAPPNKKLLDLESGTWVKLGGGRCLGGGEIPLIYDQASGFILKYGGCNNEGTTFAGGYGNDLSAYDPATERWIALRWTDPCGPPRPPNGCTRAYACDTANQCVWFAGGVAGNALARSYPPGADSKAGTWRYDSLRDRFEYAAGGPAPDGEATISGYDPMGKRFVVVGMFRGGANGCDPATGKWSPLAQPPPFTGQNYTYACFVDSIKIMLVVKPGGDKVTAKTFALNVADGQWKDLSPKGDTPPARAPASAYDPDNDVVLCVGDGRTMAYLVKENAWKTVELKAPMPKVAGMLAFDRRHKVFLDTAAMGGEVWAFRYRR